MIKLLLVTCVVSSCGYQVPKDQCVGKGTECGNHSSSTGERGPQGVPGPVGPSGPAGPQGIPGARGEAGSSCTTVAVSNGATINCDDGTTVVILNGVNGTDGQAGSSGQDAPASAYSIVEAYDPCGDQSGFDEILLRTAGGNWIAHFSGPGTEFLTILTPGNYRTTDATHCYFTVTSQLQITGEHN